MTNLMHAYMNEIGIPTALESSIVQIHSLLLIERSTQHATKWFQPHADHVSTCANE